MAEPTPPAPPTADPTVPAAGPAVIRLTQTAEESSQDRLLKKYLPAFVISGAAHVIVLVAAILGLPPSSTAAQPSDEIITAVAAADEPEQSTKDLTNTDEGLDSALKAAIEVDRVEDQNIDAKVVKEEPVGVVGAESQTPMDTPPLAGIGPSVTDQGVTGTEGNFLAGAGGNAGFAVAKAMSGRSGSTKVANLKAGGGNDKSELAVARGLAWLATQQKGNGSWVFDGEDSNAVAAATGLSLLPFLAAGQTHKPQPGAKGQTAYHQNVEKGIQFLLNMQRPDGLFPSPEPNQHMYAHAIATLALCECYGMTGDKARLYQPVQRAINYIQAAQASNGSWGYTPNKLGDTSIVGWQVQALKAADLCRDIQVSKAVLTKAAKFLDSVSDKSRKATYGYLTPPGDPTSAVTAVGLLCRYYIDGWGPLHPGMAEGVKNLVTRRPPGDEFEMYYYYYATQVVHFHDGDFWQKDWNPKMRDLLISRQVSGKGPKVDGSWDGGGRIYGAKTGRLGNTCLAILTLEVYYRHLPTYKRMEGGGMKELERVK